MRRLRYAALALTLGFAPMTAGAGDFMSALSAAQGGNYGSAYRTWRRLAEEGDPRAQYNLGIMYQNGHGIPPDGAAAAAWFDRAAEGGVDGPRDELDGHYLADDPDADDAGWITSVTGRYVFSPPPSSR